MKKSFTMFMQLSNYSPDHEFGTLKIAFVAVQEKWATFEAWTQTLLWFYEFFYLQIISTK